jgi:hypothetical protein
MRLVVLELGVEMESIAEKGTLGGEMRRDSVWGTGRGCSTTKNARIRASSAKEW